MKQKQANLGEARSARKQAADTARQGNFILAFTVVTVIFVRSFLPRANRNCLTPY